jgi:hypothetical protein
MRKFDLPNFLKLMTMLEKDARYAAEEKWSDKQQRLTTARLLAIAELANVSGLLVTKQQAAHLFAAVTHPNYKRQTDFPTDVANLRHTMARELAGLVYLEIPANQVHFWNAVNPFGDAVIAMFPETRDDIEEASKCLALDRGTACVFHLMCAIDLGLQRFAKKLKANYDPKWDWNKILEEIKAKIDLMKSKRKTQLQVKEKYLGAYTHLHGIRAAWRNPTMHSRRQYKPDEALEVFNASKAFMRQLSEIL